MRYLLRTELANLLMHKFCYHWAYFRPMALEHNLTTEGALDINLKTTLGNTADVIIVRATSLGWAYSSEYVNIYHRSGGHSV